MNFELLYELAQQYFFVGFSIVFANAFMSGYGGLKWKISELRDIFLWPISIVILIGIISRLCVNSFKSVEERK